MLIFCSLGVRTQFFVSLFLIISLKLLLQFSFIWHYLPTFPIPLGNKSSLRQIVAHNLSIDYAPMFLLYTELYFSSPYWWICWFLVHPEHSFDLFLHEKCSFFHYEWSGTCITLGNSVTFNNPSTRNQN